MRRINGLKEGLELFRTLGSESRMQIVTLLAANTEMSLSELSAALGVTQGALTTHIRMLEEQDLIDVTVRHTAHGLQKVCSLKDYEVLLNVYPSVEESQTKVYQTEVPIGHYSDYSVNTGCGLVTEKALVGSEDDRRVFSYPERLDAQMLWFHDGFIEYRIPNFLPENNRIVQLTISVEMCCAEQGSEQDLFSDIDYYLNGRKIGSWLASTQDRNISRGIYTPAWYKSPMRQHGFLKMLVINNAAIYIDGNIIQETGTNWPFLDENGEMRFRIETHSSGEHPGGVALYGKQFGNYNQNIQVIVHYMPEEMVQQLG